MAMQGSIVATMWQKNAEMSIRTNAIFHKIQEKKTKVSRCCVNQR